jgi:hypothetical protein
VLNINMFVIFSSQKEHTFCTSKPKFYKIRCLLQTANSRNIVLNILRVIIIDIKQFWLVMTLF